MIPGDIDLTENLDFRKVVKKEIPQLPALWDGKNKLNVSDINRYTITTTYSATSSLSYDLSYDITDATTSYITYSYYDSINNDWFNLSDQIINLVVSDFSLDTSGFTYITSSSNTTSSRFRIYQNPEYDVFGNKIEPPEYIPNIPWGGNGEHSYEDPIPWGWREERDFSLRTRYYDDRIPWDDEVDTSDWPEVRMDNNNRLRYSIAWFKNKTVQFINNYFEPDHETDLRYLNNMSWIRVRDAVID